MPEQLSERVTKGLDALPADSIRLVHDYLGRRLARDQDPNARETEPAEDQDPSASLMPSTLSTPGSIPGMSGPADEEQDDSEKLDRLCGILEELGVDDEKVRQLRQMLTSSDGNLLLQHKSNGNGNNGRNGNSGAYGQGGAPNVGPPETFPGQPHVGGTMTPMSDRRAVRDAARSTKVADQAGHISYVKDMPPPRAPKPMAMDSVSRESTRADFLRRFPEAARIGFR
jgi:hypothetical protein